MTQGEKNAAYVGALIGVLLFSVPASRDYIVELVSIIGAMVYFGLLVLWNWLLSVSWMVLTGIVMGVIFTAAAVAGERVRK